MNRQFYITGLRFVRTHDILPEQYNIFDSEKMIAYARVRWSYFSVHLLTAQGAIGELVYGVPIDGYGSFNPAEREYQLAEAAKNIKLHLVNESENS